MNRQLAFAFTFTFTIWPASDTLSTDYPEPPTNAVDGRMATRLSPLYLFNLGDPLSGCFSFLQRRQEYAGDTEDRLGM